EDMRLVEWIRREEQDREGGERGGGEAQREATARSPARIREPERDDEQRRELRPARQRRENPARRRPRGEPEPPDEEARHDRVVRVRVRDVLGEGVRRPGEREHRSESLTAQAQPDKEEAEQRQ